MKTESVFWFQLQCQNVVSCYWNKKKEEKKSTRPNVFQTSAVINSYFPVVSPAQNKTGSYLLDITLHFNSMIDD